MIVTPNTPPLNRDAARLHASYPWMTEAQLTAYFAVKARWDNVGLPQREICGNAAMVECFYPEGRGSMWVGIEPDGYTHS